MSQSQNIQLYPLQIPDFQYNFEYQVRQYHTSGSEEETPHIHDSLEIYVNVSGDVSFLVGDKLYPIKKGDVVVSKPGQVHICISDKEQLHENFCFWVTCSENSPLFDFTMQKDFQSYYHFPEKSRQELLELLYQFQKAEENKAEPSRTACFFRLLAFLSEVTQKPVPEQTTNCGNMQPVLAHIHSHFQSIRTTQDIANATHLSCSTLNRLFRKNLQISPHKYVEALKLSYAQKLLLEGYSVTESCSQSGFPDCSRFICIFKERFGQTPLQYQKNKRA